MKETIKDKFYKLRTFLMGAAVTVASVAPSEAQADSPDPVQDTMEVSVPDNEPEDVPSISLNDLIRASKQINGTGKSGTQQNRTRQRTVRRSTTRRFATDQRVQDYCEQNNIVAITPAAPELQAKLDRNRFSAIYQTYQNEVYYRYGQAYTRRVPGKVLIVPHNPNEKLYIYSSYDSAREASEHNIGAFGSSRPSHGRHFGISRGGR